MTQVCNLIVQRIVSFTVIKGLRRLCLRFFLPKYLLPICFLPICLPVASKETASNETASSELTKAQAGYYQFKLGSVDVFALSDGSMALDPKKILHEKPKTLEKMLKESYLNSHVETSVNAYLVVLPKYKILVDAGAGTVFGPTLNKLTTSLNNAGYQPQDIDQIVITHMHGDHLGGITQDGKATFPNARLNIERQELDYWTNAKTFEGVKAPDANIVKQSLSLIKPYQKRNQLNAFAGKTQLFPGFTAIPMRGHTPGHCIYELESNGMRLQFWGDTLHVAAVQFQNPTITIDFDSDTQSAAASRQQLFTQAAKHKTFIALPHVSFPGLGRIRALDSGYQWLPVLYRNNAQSTM